MQLVLWLYDFAENAKDSELDFKDIDSELSEVLTEERSTKLINQLTLDVYKHLHLYV